MVIMRSQLKNERGNIYIHYTTMRPSDATKKALKQILGIKKKLQNTKKFLQCELQCKQFFPQGVKKVILKITFIL